MENQTYKQEIIDRTNQMYPQYSKENIERYINFFEKVTKQPYAPFIGPSDTEISVREGIDRNKQFIKGQDTSGAELVCAVNVARLKYRLWELQAPRREAERMATEKEEKYVGDLLNSATDRAAVAMAFVLAQEEKKREDEEKVRLKREADARIQEIKKDYEERIKERDKIIELQKEVIKQQQETIENLKKSQEIVNLAKEYLKVTLLQNTNSPTVSNNSATLFSSLTFNDQPNSSVDLVPKEQTINNTI